MVRKYLLIGGASFILGAGAMAYIGQSATAKLAPRSAPIIVQSVDGISLQCAPCCHPVPGDRIVGHMRGGHGLAIHRIDCDTAR